MKAIASAIRLTAIFMCFAFCSDSNDSDTNTNTNTNTGADDTYEVINAFPKLSFTRPVDFQQPNDNSNRVFVVEQAGVISVFPQDAATAAKTTFLDIKDRVEDNGNEQGLLGLAFHPNYSTNGYFYVNYTAANPNRNMVSRFKVSSSNPNQADPASEVVLLSIPDPYGNHNGGQVTFGPDGYLYIACGDGGSGASGAGDNAGLH